MIELMANQALNREDDNADMTLLICWKSAQLVWYFTPAMELNKTNLVHLQGVTNTIKE